MKSNKVNKQGKQGKKAKVHWAPNVNKNVGVKGLELNWVTKGE
jgi:hypothetical protein